MNIMFSAVEERRMDQDFCELRSVVQLGGVLKHSNHPQRCNTIESSLGALFP